MARVDGGAARSLADVTVETPSLIRIAGLVDISAGADNAGKGPAAASFAASANADLTLAAGAMAGGVSPVTSGSSPRERMPGRAVFGLKVGSMPGPCGIGRSDELIQAR